MKRLENVRCAIRTLILGLLQPLGAQVHSLVTPVSCPTAQPRKRFPKQMHAQAHRPCLQMEGFFGVYSLITQGYICFGASLWAPT